MKENGRRKIVKIRSSLLGIAAAALLAAAATLSQMGGASAAITTPASHFSHVLTSATGTAKHTDAPDISNFYTYTEINFGGTQFSGACIQGEVYEAADPVASVINNCEYHIYLQYSDAPAFCINAHSDRTDIGSQYRNPVTIQVGPGTSSCPMTSLPLSAQMTMLQRMPVHILCSIAVA
jgi:hypothetical protein